VGTVQVLREKYHSSQLVEHLTLLDPLVAARVQGSGAALAARWPIRRCAARRVWHRWARPPRAKPISLPITTYSC
jgi:hypothetical protein